MGAKSIQQIIGAEELNGADISQPYADIYSLGGEEKITTKKLDSHISATLDAACSF
jgi:hypothetical protein